jgi:competence protein ComEC
MRPTNSLTVTAGLVRPLQGAGRLDALRARAATVIDSAFRRDAPLAKALLIADTRALTPEVRDRYAAAGLAHMLSISGLHVGLIAVALVLAAQVARVPAIVGRVATIVVLAAYIAIIGAPAPAVRSGIMLGAAMLCRLVQRQGSGAPRG